MGELVKKPLKYPDNTRKKQFKLLHKRLHNEIHKEENTKKLRNRIKNHVIDAYKKKREYPIIRLS